MWCILFSYTQTYVTTVLSWRGGGARDRPNNELCKQKYIFLKIVADSIICLGLIKKSSFAWSRNFVFLSTVYTSSGNIFSNDRSFIPPTLCPGRLKWSRPSDVLVVNRPQVSETINVNLEIIWNFPEISRYFAKRYLPKFRETDSEFRWKPQY